MPNPTQSKVSPQPDQKTRVWLPNFGIMRPIRPITFLSLFPWQHLSSSTTAAVATLWQNCCMVAVYCGLGEAGGKEALRLCIRRRQP